MRAETALLKEQIKTLLKKGVLVSPDILERLERTSEITSLLSEDMSVVILDTGSEQLIKNGEAGINWAELEKTKVLLEKEKDSKRYSKVMGLLQKKTVMKGTVTVTESYEEPARKYDVKDFAALFNARYNSIKTFLSGRPDMASSISISRAKQRQTREKTNLIAMISDKQQTKNGNTMLTIEDRTGSMRAMATKGNAKRAVNELVCDEVVGISGEVSNEMLLAEDIILPDIPDKELKKSNEPGQALFLSDLHVGSVNFLDEDFNKFLRWLSGRAGSQEQRRLAEQVKYLFIIGDLVDGIGVYPEQEKELSIKDIYSQYEKCAELLTQIPQDIHIILCPGNHDATRIAEPQPALYQDFTQPIAELPNVTRVSNPAMVNIDASENFQGFSVLLYHGYSFDYYVATVEPIRLAGGYDRADLIMRFLLRRRHLAPAHTSTLYLPNAKRDPLVIDKVPDFFATGHIHKASISNYKNTTLICGSCWQSKTGFQERVGHHPEPARVPIVDLQTRKAKILRFGK